MKKLFFLMLVFISTFSIVGCSDDFDTKNVLTHNQTRTEIQSGELTTDSLILKLKSVNEEFATIHQNNEAGIQTRGFREWWNGIKVGLADARGAYVGFCAGGWAGAIIGAVVYSVCAIVQLTLTDTSGLCNMPQMEYAYGNITYNPQINNDLVTSIHDRLIELPEGYLECEKIGIKHNLGLEILSGKYADVLGNYELSKTEKDEIYSTNFLRSYNFLKNNTELAITSNPRSMRNIIPPHVDEREIEVISLFFDACEKSTSSIQDIQSLAERYVGTIETDNTIPVQGRKRIYGAMSTMVYSMSFWEKNYYTYELSEEYK